MSHPIRARERYFTPDKTAELTGEVADLVEAGEYAPGHSDMMARVTLMLDLACEKHLADDVVDYHASFEVLPSDGDWVPAVLLYVMLQPVGTEDGDHEGDFVNPYGLTQGYVDAFIARYADRTADKRQKLREARARGDAPAAGLAIPGDKG